MPHPSAKRRYQRALYWPKEGKVHGEPTLAVPQELRVRWEWTRREIRAADSSTIALDAQVFANQELTQGGYLWLAPNVNETALQQWQGAGVAPGWDVVQVVTTTKMPDLRNRSNGRTASCQRAADWVPGGYGIQRIPDLKLWLHADRGIYTTSVGTNAADNDADPVGRWVSQDVYQHELLQATSVARPVMRKDIIRNSEDVVRLDGSDDALAAAVDRPLTGVLTVYLSGAITTTLGLRSISLSDVVDVTVGGNARLGDGSTTATLAYGGGTGTKLFRWRRDSDGNSWFAATGQAEAVLSGAPSGTVSLGQLASAAGDYRQVLVFARDLNTAERKLVEDYLTQDAGVELL